MSKHRNSFQVFASRDCIDNSERNSLYWCIWALAIIYSIKGAIRVQVDRKESRFSYRGFRYVFPTPEKSASIAKAYDDGIISKAQIKPWSDVLKDPISVEPIQHKRQSRATNRASKKTKKAPCSRRKSSRWSGGRI